jgi:hydroxymethylpyrimidine/phosphomethylpyrimidine kinase
MRGPIVIGLTIAGSDSSAGAGIQADLKTFAALGVYGTSSITAITAQSTTGVTAVQPLAADIVTAQIEAVASDLRPSATKTGMLATAAIVEAVAAAIVDLDLPRVVVDPVMLAKSGDRLLDPDAITAMRDELFRLALVVTPNIPEAEALTGHPIRSADDIRAAARAIHASGPSAVIVKGGHGTGREVVDVLFDGRTFHQFRTARIETANTHGTGCTFASAIAAYLALGFSLVEATEQAQAYVAGAIRDALAIGHGHGPLNHFWRDSGSGTRDSGSGTRD